jgi:hypothetical protein
MNYHAASSMEFDPTKSAGTREVEAALAGEICLNLPVTMIDPAEIYRYLGYPSDTSPAPRFAEKIAGIAAETLACIQPRGVYSLYKVAERTAHSLTLGKTTISGNIGEYLGDADRIAVFVVTVGEEISHLATSKDDDAFAAWIVDATGSWAVESAADALMRCIQHHLQDEEELTLRYSPGYCGMEIGEQRKLFQLVQADAVAVTLMPSMLMHPLKSISGLVGLAPKETVGQHRSPCDLCLRTGCHMRR